MRAFAETSAYELLLCSADVKFGMTALSVDSNTQAVHSYKTTSYLHRTSFLVPLLVERWRTASMPFRTSIFATWQR